MFGLQTQETRSSRYQRQLALREATKTMTKHSATRQVKDALQEMENPNGTDIHDATIGYSFFPHSPKKD